MPIILQFNNVTFKRNNRPVFENFSWEIRKNESWAITGGSGSGKTSLLEALQGKFFLSEGSVWNAFNGHVEYGIHDISKHTAFLFFQDQDLNYNSFYYQQRYNSTEAEGTVNVRDFLGGQNLTSIPEEFHLSSLLDKEIIKLSNGETRKVLLAKALLKNPKLLVLDNPFLGLDAGAREMVKNLIDHLISCGMQVIMTAHPDEIPQSISKTLHLDKFNHNGSPPFKGNSLLKQLKFAHTDADFSIAARLKDVIVRYDDKCILDLVSWTIRRNEKWALTGKNGAGKSMLLSLIFADNPQAYANEMILFDNSRGQGESIWDIKEKVGFLSPEVHFYCDKKLTCRETALEGLYSNPYKKVVITDSQEENLKILFEYYGIEHLADVPLSRVSTSQQRLVLFLGVLMKDPLLLLLDEPFQGFDAEMVEKSKLLLNDYCRNKTMVFVSHYEPEIPECIDRFARLERGQLTIDNDQLTNVPMCQ